ncbi:hypothetical protein SXCC_02108 [Gluconacetobacter sp. SXCC-1]|nr:hypothetical protein SXCC_02108 [Gluconacetobacter sp. SXCC-1]
MLPWPRGGRRDRGQNVNLKKHFHYIIVFVDILQGESYPWQNATRAWEWSSSWIYDGFRLL